MNINSTIDKMEKKDALMIAYADKTLKEYEKKIDLVVFGKFRTMSDVSEQDREDVAEQVCNAMWVLFAGGKFMGLNEDASIKACINAIATNKKNDFLKKFIVGKKLRVYDSAPRDNAPDGEVAGDTEPLYDKSPDADSKVERERNPARVFEARARIGFIDTTSRFPDVLFLSRKGYSMVEIARKVESGTGKRTSTGMIKKRLRREMGRLIKRAKEEEWYYERRVKRDPRKNRKRQAFKRTM